MSLIERFHCIGYNKCILCTVCTVHTVCTMCTVSIVYILYTVCAMYVCLPYLPLKPCVLYIYTVFVLYVHTCIPQHVVDFTILTSVPFHSLIQRLVPFLDLDLTGE